MNRHHDAEILKHRYWVSDTLENCTCETNTSSISSGSPISIHLATYNQGIKY